MRYDGDDAITHDSFHMHDDVIDRDYVSAHDVAFAVYQWTYRLHVLPYNYLRVADRIFMKFDVEVTIRGQL
jgi:hypothetical protein